VDIFRTLTALDYGEVHFGHDAASGLRAIVAIHSTRLGPAIGGCRIRAYASEADAIEDVTRLAQGMSYKAAHAGLPHGGGKSVILAPPDLNSPGFDRARLFRAFGAFVDGLGGRYLTAEDSGTSPADMNVIRGVTRHVLGASPEVGGAGDPSPFTALGCRRGIEAIAEHVLGRKTLQGMHIAIQGVGHVGYHLARELSKLGVQLTIADIDPARVALVVGECGARSVPIETIFDVECDIVAPCALGSAITEDVARKVRTRAIAGAANNQLRTPAAGQILAERGIFYAPDYIINGGGLIHVADEYAGYDKARATAGVMKVYDSIRDLYLRAQKEKARPEIVADQIAKEIIARAPRTA
jgi:leucine dehydrogenase